MPRQRYRVLPRMNFSRAPIVELPHAADGAAEPARCYGQALRGSPNLARAGSPRLARDLQISSTSLDRPGGQAVGRAEDPGRRSPRRC